MKRPLAATLLAICLGLAANPIAAQASCAGFGAPLKDQLDSATTVFVGTVVGTASSDRVARVRVESVWKGSARSTVTVSGTPDQGAAATSVDRTFSVGQRYLFVPVTNSSPFQDNSCSATRPYGAQLDSLKPAGARPPAPGDDGLDPTGLAFAPAQAGPLLGVLVIAAAAVAWLLLRRRRQAAR